MNSSTPHTKKIILAFVGMPGSGKSEAVSYTKQQNIPFVRFGKITDDALKEKGLELNPENEKKFREQLRSEFGMNAFAEKSKTAIDNLLVSHDIIAIDGLYSWEEYTYLKKIYPGLLLIHVYTEPSKRYERLSKREIRPLNQDEARKRDTQEIEKLNKGGPIAIADFMLDNDGDLEQLHEKIDQLLKNLSVN